MKKLLIAALILSIGATACANKISKKNVPNEVSTSFKNSYQNATKVHWDKEDQDFEASFKVAGNDHSVLMDASGNIKETEVAIDAASLPANAQTFLTKNYPSKKIKETATITDAAGSLTYEAEVDGLDILFDASGNFLKAEKE